MRLAKLWRGLGYFIRREIEQSLDFNRSVLPDRGWLDW